MKDKVICYCKNVKKSEIVRAIKEGAKNLKDIQLMTEACTGNKCKELNPKGRCCIKEVMEILKEFNLSAGSNSCCSEGCC